MKKLLFLTIVLALASCTAAPTPAPVQPVAQEPVVVTVVVQPTQAPAQQDPIVVTVVVPASPVPAQPTPIQPTQAPAATTDPSVPAALVIDDVLGKGVFTNITLTGDEFSLRCTPREITLTATSALLDISEAELFYRTVDQPRALYYSEWKTAGKMNEASEGVFSMVLTGESVHPDLRLDPGWFEFQIVGLNRGGGRVDATEKIEQLVTYRINCR